MFKDQLSKIKKRFFNPQKRITSIALILLVFVPTAIVVQNFFTNKVKATWIDPEWQYRQVVLISSHNSSEDDVYVTLPTFDATDSNKFQSDCGDLRFTDLSGVVLPYYVVDCDSTATIHVHFNTLPAGNTYFYMYYGNSNAANGFEASDLPTVASNIGGITFQEEESRLKPLAHWKMDEVLWDGTTNEVVDSTGNSNHGTSSTGATTEANGISNRAGSFDGTDDVLQMNYVNPGANLTLSTWVNPTTLSEAGLNYLITAYRGGCVVDRGWVPYALAITGGQLQYRVEQTTSCAGGSTFDVYNANNPDIPTNEYSLVTVTVENNTSESRVVTFYVNGIRYSTTQASNFASTGAFSGSGFSTYIGGKSSTLYSGYHGLIDEARIYNRILSSDEILDTYNYGIGYTERDGNGIGYSTGDRLPTPMIHYKLDEQSGQVINNYIDGTSNGTLGMSTSVEGIDPIWSNPDSCRTNGCQTFTGSQYTNVGNIGDLSTNYSVSMWFNTDVINENNIMISYRTDNLSNGNAVVFQLDHNNADIRFIVRNQAGTTMNATASSAIVAGQWYHLLGVRENNSIKLYIDGVLKATSSAAVNTIPGNRLIIGTYYNDLNNATDPLNNFIGDIDEVKIYNVALNNEQVILDYNAGSALNVGTTSNTLGASLTGGNGSAPIAEYLFDENTGTSAKDTSTNNSTGTLNNGTTWAPGKIGSSVLLDGVDDNVTFPSSTPLNIGTSDFTIEAYVKGNNLENSDIILGKTDGGACSTTYGYSLGIFDSLYPTLHFCTAAGSHAKIQGTQALSNNQWYHIAAVVDRDSTANTRMYINGLQVTTTVANLATHTGSITNTVNLAIGSESDNGFNWVGEIDQVRIYNYARNQTQIAYNYNRGEPITWLKLDQNTGTTAFDSISTQVTGTLTGMSVPSAWISGNSCRFNGCLDFDGTDDRVILSNESLYDFERTTAFSACTWVNFDTLSVVSQTLISKLDGSNRGWELSAYDGGFGGGAGDSNGITFYLISTFPGNRIGIAYDDLFTVGQWYHICVTYNGSSNSSGVVMYHNGKIIQPQVNNSTLTQTTLNNISVHLGRRSTGTLPLNGKMDDVRIYNYQLSQTQVQQIYNNGAALLYE